MTKMLRFQRWQYGASALSLATVCLMSLKLVLPWESSEVATNRARTPQYFGEISIPASGGQVLGEVFWFAVPDPHAGPGFTQCVQLVYLPKSGKTWSGSLEEANLAFYENRLVGFAQSLLSSEMRVLVSSNSYTSNAVLRGEAFETELSQFERGQKTNYLAQRYTINIDKLFGVSDLVLPSTRTASYRNFSTNRMPDGIVSVRVAGTNLIVTAKHRTLGNISIALDSEFVPIWATTNGVSIGSIPTNCVFYSDIVSNKLETKVVY